MKQKLNKVKSMVLFVLVMAVTTGLVACANSDDQRTIDVQNKLKDAQQTPTDIEYSLERYNLIRRAYWVNGMPEKASSLPCIVVKPSGYVMFYSESGDLIKTYAVDGKVSSLRSYLTADTTMPNGSGAMWLADVDGSYGDNVDGIFFFTPEGDYIEYNGKYIYSSVPFKTDETLLDK